MNLVEMLKDVHIPEDGDFVVSELVEIRDAYIDEHGKVVLFELMHCCYKLGYLRGKEKALG